MAVTSSRQWDVFGGAPWVWLNGTPPFVPPLPRLAFQTFAPQHLADTAPFVWLFGNPPVIPPTPHGPIGAGAFAARQDDTYSPVAPFSWIQTVVPPQVTQSPIRGSAAFSSFREQTDWKAVDVWVRSTVGIPTLQTLAAPAFRASFVKASGWWDVLSEAPFFFAAGYSQQPPGPPVMNAYGAPQSVDMEPWRFTKGSAFTISPFPISVTDFAFPPQHVAERAPHALARGLVPPPAPFPPLGASITTRQLEGDTAAFTFVSGLYTTLAFTPAFVPPRGRTAIGEQQNADQAPFYWINKSVLPPPTIPISVTDFVFAIQHAADTAPFVLTRSLPLQFSNVPPLGSAITTRALEADIAAFTWARAVFKATPVHIAGSVFAKLHDDAIAAFVWTRDRAPIPFIPTPIPGRVFVPSDQYSANNVPPFVLTRNGIILPNIARPVRGFPIGEVQAYEGWVRAPFFFTIPGLLQETAPGVLGLLVQQAVFNLVNAGLEVFIQYGYSPTIPYGYVIAQDPIAGTLLPPWSVVTITASEGQNPNAPPGIHPVTVPNFVGMTAYAADIAVFQARLSLSQYSWVINVQTAGTVVSQLPLPGASVAPGTLVSLTLSLGPAKVVPPIVSPP